MLAIVIPYFKIIFFEETLSSLSAQTNKNFKVYIGDDASPDNPSDLINSYRDKLNITYQRFEQNLGGISLTGQWDRCIEMIQEEEWLMILGDDDVFGPKVVQNFYQHYEIFAGKSNVVRFASRTIDEIKVAISQVYAHPVWESAIQAQYRRMIGYTRSSLSEYAFSREVYSFEKFHDFPLAWHSDDNAWIDFSRCKPIYTINESLVFVRNSHFNISNRDDNLNLKDIARALFFKRLITKKLKYFERFQRFTILKRYEDLKMRMGNWNFKEWYFLLFYYLKNFDLIIFLKFLKRTVFNFIFK